MKPLKLDEFNTNSKIPGKATCKAVTDLADFESSRSDSVLSARGGQLCFESIHGRQYCLIVMRTARRDACPGVERDS